MRGVWGLLVLMAFSAGCTRKEEKAPAAEKRAGESEDSAVVEETWITLAIRTHQSESVLPIPFRATSAELRVITRMGAMVSPVSPGRVITNILSEASALPLASVRAEQNRPDSVMVDTAGITAGPGDLRLYVAEHRGLKTWEVVVQEKHKPSF